MFLSIRALTINGIFALCISSMTLFLADSVYEVGPPMITALVIPLGISKF